MRKVFNLLHKKTLRKRLRNNSSAAELVLWQNLQHRRFLGLKFRRQQSIGRYVVDFYCPARRLAIEVDGDSHFDSKSIEYDQDRDEWMRNLGICVIRFTNDEIFHDLFGVFQRLKEVISTTPNPSSSEEGR